MVLGFFSGQSNVTEPDEIINFNLYNNFNPELDSKCVAFIENKRLELESGQLSTFNSFWNPDNFKHYNKCNTPTELYNEISFNLTLGTSLNNERLGVFISQIGNLISSLDTDELFNVNYNQHKQLSGLFYNEELQDKSLEDLSFIFLSIRLLFEIYHLSPNEYIKSLAITQILKNREIIHLIFTFSSRLPRVSYSISNINSIYSSLEPITSPKDNFFNNSINDNSLGLPQTWINNDKSQNFLINIIIDSLTNNNLNTRIFGCKISDLSSFITSTNGNLLYLLKSNLNQQMDDLSESIISNVVLDVLSNIIHFIPESVAIHFINIFYLKEANFKINHFILHLKFINYCRSIPKTMPNCCHVAYNLCWHNITTLNQNISQVKSTSECLLIIDLLCKYYECTTRLVYNDSISYQQSIELITLCLQISQQPFSDLTNKLHSAVFNSLIHLFNMGRIDTSILYLTLINFNSSLNGSDIINMKNNYSLSSHVCCNFLYNQNFKQFLHSNISQIGYIILKICCDSLVSVTVRHTHISYKGAQKNIIQNNDIVQLNNISLPKNINILECIKLAIDVIIVISTSITNSNWNDIKKLIFIVHKIYYTCLRETINQVIDKHLLKDLTECIVSLFKQLVSRDHYTVCRLFYIFIDIVKKSTIMRFSKKFFESCLLDNYDTQAQILYYLSLRYFEAINLPLPLFKSMPVQYYSFDTTILNLAIFKSYFLGPYKIAKINKHQNLRILSIDFYHSWQNVLKTHIIKLYPILLKSENLFLKVGKVHHIFIYGCLSSGLFQLTNNYFNQITFNLVTEESLEWYRILQGLSLNKLSLSLDALSVYCNKRKIYINNTENNFIHINNSSPQPILFTWLSLIVLLSNLYNEFGELLLKSMFDVCKIHIMITKTRQIIVSLKLIDMILSTKSMYSRYCARLYLAKAKLLHYLLSTLKQDYKLDLEYDLELLGEEMYNIIDMLDKDLIDKMNNDIDDEMELWSNSLSIGWAMEFIEHNKESGDDIIFTHPTVYFRPINEIFNKNVNQSNDLHQIVKGVNEILLPIPLVMLFPNPLFYLPLICTITNKAKCATTMTIKCNITKDLINKFNLSNLNYIRVNTIFKDKDRNNKLFYDIRIANILKISMLKDTRVVEYMSDNVEMYSLPLNREKLPIGQPCKVLVIINNI